MQWGASHETDALAGYLVLQSAVTSLSVTPSGLTLLPSHPFLGASGDGRITDTSETGSGVLEIKCPYSINGQLVNTMEVFKIVELDHREFCLEMSDQDFEEIISIMLRSRERWH